MKRFLLIVVALVLLAIVVIAVWQPRALQRRAVNWVSQKVAQTTPYRLQVGDVRGNVFTRIQLLNVRVTPVDWTEPIAEADALELGLRWRALLQRRIQVVVVKLERPTVRLIVNEDRTLRLPTMPPAKESKKAGMPMVIDLIAIEKGRVLVANLAASPNTHLEISPVDLKAAFTPEALTIESFLAGINEGELRAQGSWRPGPTPSTSLKIQTRQFPFHTLLKAIQHPPKPLRLVHSGIWNVGNEGRTWRFDSDGTLNGSALKADAEVDLQGPYHVRADLAPLVLRDLWRDPSMNQWGRLSGHVDVSAPTPKSKAIQGRTALRLALAGAEKLQPVVEARAELKDGEGPVYLAAMTDGLVAAGTAQLQLPAEKVDSHFDVVLTSFSGLAQWVPALRAASGRLNAQGRVTGTFSDLSVDVAGRGEWLGFGDQSVEELGFTAQGGTGPGREVTAKASVKNVSILAAADSPWDVLSGELAVAGKKTRWKPNVDVSFRNKTVLHVQGTYETLEKGWEFVWDQVRLAPPSGPAYVNAKPGKVHAHPDGTLEIHDFELANGEGRLVMNRAKVKKGFADLAVEAKTVPIAPFVKMVAPDKTYEGRLDASITLDGPTRSPHGLIQLAVSSGSFQGLDFKQAHLDLRLAPPWIELTRLLVRMPVNEQDIHGQGKIPMRLIDPQQPDQPLHVELEAPKLDPHFFTALMPALVIDKGGSASLRLVADGHYPELAVNGTFLASFPHVVYPPAGLNLRDFKADIRSQGKEVEIREVVGKTKKGPLRIAGKSTLPELDFVVQGTNVVLDKPKELQARLNLNVEVAGTLDAPDVWGDLLIKEATYTVPKKPKGEKKTKTEGEAAEPPKSPTWENTVLDIRAQWPRNVWYRDGLSKIETSGDIRLQKDEGTQPYMTGRIALVRGLYDAYGRDFVMDSGDIVFTGPPDINPFLNIRAKYTSGGTTVFLDVKGNAKTPQLQLSSNPPLPEQDIVSVLVFGQPLNQIGPSDSGSSTKNQQASALAGSVLTGLVTKELREQGLDLGLDVVRVEPTTAGNRLTVGRYIGQKLFISYGQPIQGEANRVFNADYYLTKELTLMGQTASGDSADNHVDLQFRLPLNKPRYPDPLPVLRTSSSSPRPLDLHP